MLFGFKFSSPISKFFNLRSEFFYVGFLISSNKSCFKWEADYCLPLDILFKEFLRPRPDLEVTCLKTIFCNFVISSNTKSISPFHYLQVVIHTAKLMQYDKYSLFINRKITFCKVQTRNNFSFEPVKEYYFTKKIR